MKKILAIIATTLAFTSSLTNAIQAAEDGWKESTFQVQHEDLKVRVVAPRKLMATSDNEYTAIGGCHVTVLFSDQFELKSVQSHWDGVTEKSRYAYTLYYTHKGADSKLGLMSRSINLANFSAVNGHGRNLAIVQMGVISDDGHIAFKPANLSEYPADNPKTLASK